MANLLLFAPAIAACAHSALAQAASTPSPDPLELVARAEQLCAGPEKEDARAKRA
jgi:hypothetical protein